MAAGTRRASRKRRQVAEINVVPYIDVMLVLLIIFMVTAPLLQQGVDIDLPKASAQTVEPGSVPPIVVSVDKRGAFYLNISDAPEQAISESALLKRVAAEHQLDANRPVLVNGDEATRYGQVVQLMVLLQSAGIEKVGLMTESPDTDSL